LPRDRSTHAFAAAEHGTLGLLATFATGAFVVVGTGFGVVVVVVVTGTVVEVGSTVDGAVVWVTMSAATAIFGAADDDGDPDEHAANPTATITADRPTTILCMRTAPPRRSSRGSTTGA
jgi:hypothetical protein